MTKVAFDETFAALTNTSPFPWQRELYQRFVSGDIPNSCNIGTGLGKTSVIPIWLIALANNPDVMPRRLVYVVNRRTVVDQTTSEVEKLRANLRTADLIETLSRLCALPIAEDEAPLAISTLRGQFADNREWSADPARPAIIVGTVDMIGSRLLFGGYGVGFKGKPLHAGFLGQDVLLVHDEAHLEPAFQRLIEGIEREQCDGEGVGRLPWPKIRVMALTATARGKPGASENDSFELTEPERNPPGEIPDPPIEPVHVVWRRLKARKSLRFTSMGNEKKDLADQIVSRALDDRLRTSGSAILIFVRAVESVEKIVAELNKKRQKVQQLTGTLRGFERDRLPADRIFARFVPASHGVSLEQGTVYLVSTSAGEVGVNISADHLVCDLTTFESMAQRLGRVNRFGNRTDSEVHIFHPAQFAEDNDYDPKRKKTLELLAQLSGDGSPSALSMLDPTSRQEAFAPMPTILPVTDILFDSWAMTSIRDTLPGRPSVEAYLHGISGEWQPPETFVAWREEVGVITGELVKRYDPEDVLEDFPLKPHELLREPSYRAFRDFQTLASRHANAPAWLLDVQGRITVLTLEQLADKKNKDRVKYATVLLAPAVGGLKDGSLDGASEYRDDELYDVSEEWFADEQRTIRRRVRVWDDPDFNAKSKRLRLVRTVDTRPDADEFEDERFATTRRIWDWYTRPYDADDDLSRTATDPIKWDHHTRDVTNNMEGIVTALGLPPNLRQALIVAAQFHDLGKRRKLWQRSIGNPNPEDWYAKSGRDPATGKLWKPIEITSYRHEFGSLLDLLDEKQPHYDEFRTLSDDMQELVLHLIAAHHGRGRPHFPADEALDPERPQREADALASDVPRRFARLQRKYGRWGLAYLESLLRAADYAASANPSRQEGAQ